ncbi:MAG: AAA family ATPase [Thiothrix sp.]
MITLIGNLKGGTGKSTITFNLALWIATRHNRRVVVYDLDPQATTADAFGIRQEEGFLPVIEPVTSVATLGSEDSLSEVLVDMGLADMAAVEAAIRKADRIVVPVAPSQADVWSTQRFLKMVADIRQGQAVEILGIINRADTHHAVKETSEAAEAMQMLRGLQLLEPRLCMRTTYRRCFSEGLAVFEMEPRSKAAQELDALGRALYPV